ncbi:MAG: FliM/FliN family flagellar motor switch protein [Acidimicrobiales bacterium]|nr:FliM/FliN family flagellar motor switch protein [Acidimicrobiales bacterium]
MSLLDLQAPAANVPEHVVAGVKGQLELLAPKCGLAMTSVVGREANLQIGDVESFAGDHPEGDFSWFRVGDPVGRSAALFVSLAGVARLAELFMGGDGRGPDRAPAPLEWSIVLKRIGSVLTGMGEVLGAFGVDSLNVTPVDEAELNLESHQIRAVIDVKIGGIGVPITLVLPAAHHVVRSAAPQVETSAALTEALSEVPVSVAIRFASVEMSADELDGLEVGDVIRLDQPEHAPLVGMVDNKFMFTGHVGRHGRRLAMKIVEIAQ